MLPAFRRRGVQSTPLAWRLTRARAASKSQQNVQRAEFHLLYPRQLLVKR
jgi:hypothetical protein